MLALHITHVLDTMTPYIVVPYCCLCGCVCLCATVPYYLCVCVCVCVPNTSTALLYNIDIYSMYLQHYYGNDVGCHGV